MFPLPPRYLSIVTAAFLPEAMASTIEVGPKTMSPHAKRPGMLVFIVEISTFIVPCGETGRELASSHERSEACPMAKTNVSALIFLVSDSSNVGLNLPSLSNTDTHRISSALVTFPSLPKILLRPQELLIAMPSSTACWRSQGKAGISSHVSKQAI